MTRLAAVAAVAVAAVVLSGCRVDVAVDVRVAQNGSGTLTVTVDADAQVVAAAPGLAEDLRVDDLRDAGWEVQGPAPSAGGGLRVVLTRPFASPEQATAVLAQLSGPQGPFHGLTLTREASPTAVRLALAGEVGVEGGMAAFADPDLLAAVGGVPYADRVAAATQGGGRPLAVQLRVALPGDVRDTSGAPGTLPPDPGAGAAAGVAAGGEPAVAWQVPLDGSRTDVAATGVVSLERGGAWSVLSAVALAALVAWLVLTAVAVAAIVRRRRRRPRRA